MAINFSDLVAHTLNIVDSVISEGFRDSIKEIERFDDRLVKLSIISADVEKDAFWQLLDAKTCNIPAVPYIIIAGDLNGHVGEKAR